MPIFEIVDSNVHRNFYFAVNQLQANAFHIKSFLFNCVIFYDIFSYNFLKTSQWKPYLPYNFNNATLNRSFLHFSILSGSPIKGFRFTKIKYIEMTKMRNRYKVWLISLEYSVYFINIKNENC